MPDTPNPAPAGVSTPDDSLLPLTLADFENAGLVELLAPYPNADCNELQPVLWAAKDTHTGGAAQALTLLGNICTMMLVPEEPAVVYRPRVVWGDGTCSMALEHLSTADIDALALVCETIAQPALRARAADLVWLSGRKHGQRFARIALELYKSTDLNFDAWRYGNGVCWHRALQLAKQIGAKDEADQIEAALLDVFFDAANSTDFAALHYLQPLVAEKRAGARAHDIAEQLEKIGRRHLAAAHPFPAQSYFEASSDWYQRAGRAEKQADMLAMVAEAIALQAEQGDGAMIEHSWLTKAIEAYRQVPGHARERLGVNEAIDALRRRREIAGHAMLGEMVTIRGPRIDVSDLVKASVEHVSNRNPFEALLSFCGLDSTPDAAATKADAEKSLREHPLSALFGGAVMSADGRQVANTGPEEGREQQIAAKSREIFRQHASLVAVSSIVPALDQLRKEHSYRRDDFIAIAERSPVVPVHRARMVGQGLHAGFCGDMVQALHILMPQFEHIVRHTLQGVGTFTAQHDRDGLDSEVGLSRLIERPQMVEEFGEGLTLSIHSIMCDRAGSNLRNDIAHGLADEELCESALALYAWWIILKLIVETCAATLEAEKSTSAHPSSGSSAASAGDTT